MAMTRLPKLLTIAVSSFLAAACERTVTVEIPLDENLQLEIQHLETGTINARHCELEAGSDEVAQISSWLDENRDGWEPSVVTFAPGVMIRGSDFTLNFLGDGAILNYDEGQFTHPTDSYFYANLRCSIQ